MTTVFDQTFQLDICQLHFILKAQTGIRLGRQAGGQIRGALWHNMKTESCTDHHKGAAHRENCPLCRLVDAHSTGKRGQNPARPFTVRPPLSISPMDDRVYEAGQTFTIGVNLLGNATDLIAYVSQAIYRMGKTGLGYGRGQFTLQRVQLIHPLSGKATDLLDDQHHLTPQPATRLSFDMLADHAQSLSQTHVHLCFLTPTEIKQDGKLLSQPTFPALIGRILERCQSLEENYSDTPTRRDEWRDYYQTLTDAAQAITTQVDGTQWITVKTGSTRANQRKSMSGFVGDVIFQGDMTPFLPWVLWGQMVHVGKNTVKGNGWYQIRHT